MTEKCGPLVRYWGVRTPQLPSVNATPLEIKPLLEAILSEALPFIATVPASHTDKSAPWKPTDIKTFPHSIAPVDLYERIVSEKELRTVVAEHQGRIPHLAEGGNGLAHDEFWTLRQSVHEDKAAEGTASWGEFVKYFKEEHAEAEKDFTPTVLETERTQEWDCQGVEVRSADGTTWVDWTLRLEASLHKMPLPLKNRVFPVLQATAAARGRREFLVVQIATDQVKGELSGEKKKKKSKPVVVGAYTSVERVRETERGIEWLMGTTSDAKGTLPAWVQKIAVPGAIAKDVDMFLEWVAISRGS